MAEPKQAAAKPTRTKKADAAPPPVPPAVEVAAASLPLPVLIAGAEGAIPVTFDADALKGAAGIAGEQGKRGVEGEQGAQGQEGAQGHEGAQGQSGQQGQTGQRGQQGQEGRVGEPGRRGADAPGATVAKAEGLTLSPTTTEQQDLVLERQQDINTMWETTQSRIALLVVVSGVLVNSAIILLIVFFNKEVSVTQLSLISICLQFINLTAGIIIGFYFSRTNHSARGGIGQKPVEDYQGR